MSFKDIVGMSGVNVKPREMPAADPIGANSKPAKVPDTKITIYIRESDMKRINQVIAKRQADNKRKITWTAFIRDCICEVLDKEQETNAPLYKKGDS